MHDKNGKPLEGVYVDQNGDGVINDDDRRIRHSKDPKVTMSFSSTFNWKNWDLGFALHANIGNYVYADAMSDHSVVDDCWKNGKVNNLIKADNYFNGTINPAIGIMKSDYWLRNATTSHLATHGPSCSTTRCVCVCTELFRTRSSSPSIKVLTQRLPTVSTATSIHAPQPSHSV